jgi:cobalt-precorrin 5A hydrolase
MVGGEVMNVAIGIGCRKNCPADAIETLARQVLGGIADAVPSGLFTLVDKQGEPGLVEAASRLGLNLTYLSRDALKARAEDVQTRSPLAESLFGIPSVAEAAALAGAGPASVLIVPRIAANGATCAIAGGAP